MNHSVKLISLTVSALYLTACMTTGSDNHSNYYPFGSSEQAPTLYPEGYETIGGDSAFTEPSGAVVVPQTYHMTAGTPMASKDVDKDWVNTQNPGSYTIEVASDNKASHVANTLYKTPKTARTAEVQTKNGSYKGLYGSYPSYEAAQEKLNTLPEDIKKTAGIKTWGAVQSDL